MVNSHSVFIFIIIPLIFFFHLIQFDHSMLFHLTWYEFLAMLKKSA